MLYHFICKYIVLIYLQVKMYMFVSANMHELNLSWNQEVQTLQQCMVLYQQISTKCIRFNNLHVEW